MLSMIARLFTGTSMFKIVAISVVAVFFIGLVVWLGWSRSNLKFELQKAEAEISLMAVALESNRKALVEYKDAIKRQTSALAERDIKIEQILGQRESLRRKWMEALNNDKETQEWASINLPDTVRGMLVKATGGHGD